ncbi:MAG: hypothetical protein ACOVOO_07840 [Flavobacteriales bacterium]
MRTILFTLCLLFALSANAQMERQNRALYYESEYQPKGWFGGAGFTYTFPTQLAYDQTRVSNRTVENDTLYSGRFNPKGRFGLYFEAGRHHFTKKVYLVDHIDYGIAFKQYKGREDFEGKVKADSLLAFSNIGKFGYTYLGAFFNASNIFQIGDQFWIHNSLGANVDYAIIKKETYLGPTTGMPQVFPSNLQAQLHYKLGLGWKAGAGLYFLPSIETPILNLYRFDDGKSTMAVFSSRYRPIIVSVRVMFLDRTKTKSCENQPGSKQQVDKDKPGKHQSNSLFGDEVKMKKLRKR